MSDVSRWMQNRLSPSMAKSERWTDLAKTIEKFWGEYGEPHIDAAERALSVFTADDADVDKKLSELGTKFEVALPITPSSKAMAYSMRSYEIHRKDRQETLEAILQRDFSGAVIRWMPLYAPKNAVYGAVFLDDMDLKWVSVNPKNLWQTSRGRVAVDLSAAIYYGFNRATIGAAIIRKLQELRPAHIVFDGTSFFSIHVIPVEPIDFDKGLNSVTARFGPIDADPFLTFRFDDVPADVCFLDSFGPLRHGEGIKESRSVPVKVPFRFPWRLDMGWCIDGYRASVPGMEGDLVHPLHFLFSRSTGGSVLAFHAQSAAGAGVFAERSHKFDADPMRSPRFDEISADKEQLDSSPAGAFHECITVKKPVNVPFRFPWRLDMGWCIDGQRASVPGVEGDLVHPLHFLCARTVGGSVLSFAQPSTMEMSVFTDRSHRFDANPLRVPRFDEILADKETLDCGAIGVFNECTMGQKPVKVPFRFSWRLDMGWEIDGENYQVAGTEGQQIESIHHLGGSSVSVEKIALLHTEIYTGTVESILSHGVQAGPLAGDLLPPSGDTQVTHAGFKSSLRELGDMPSFDDMPIDFFPLDMRFQQHA